jgi:hypothetical protein
MQLRFQSSFHIQPLTAFTSTLSMRAPSMSTISNSREYHVKKSPALGTPFSSCRIRQSIQILSVPTLSDTILGIDSGFLLRLTAHNFGPHRICPTDIFKLSAFPHCSLSAKGHICWTTIKYLPLTLVRCKIYDRILWLARDRTNMERRICARIA